MKKIKKILIALMAFAVSSIAVLLVACSNNDNNNGSVSLDNFTDSTATVEIGGRYVPDYLTVKDKNGNEYPLIVKVYNSKDDEVGSTDGSFNVSDFGGYTVKYTATIGDTDYVRTVAVNVIDNTAPELKILNLRSEREVGTISYPQVYVSDNSGETLAYTIDVEPTGSLDANSIDKGEGSVTFNKPGTYRFVATAKDSHGNVGREEKEIIITESMGANVWEDFSNENHMETVKNTTFLTSMTQSQWLAEFEGAYGVAKIQPNFARYYNNNFFVQLGLPKTKEEILACDWGSFTIRMYLDVKNASSVRLTNGDSFVFGDYPTGQWIDLKVYRKSYIVKANNYMFPSLLGDEDYDARGEAFALAVTQEIPRPMFSVSVGNLLSSIELSDVKIYIDQITWEDLGPDTTAPTITLNGASWQVKANTSMALPLIEVTDDRDLNPEYECKFYKVESTADVNIPIESNKVAIGDPGRYKLVVKAHDSAGNTTEKSYFFTASEKVDYKQIANYDNDYEIGIFGLYAGSGISWAESFTDKDGVTKTGLMKLTFDGNEGADVVTFTLPQAIADAMKEEMFDYVEFTFCVANEKDSYNGEYGGFSLYSLNKSIPDYSVNPLACQKWHTVKFSLDELAKSGSYLSEGSNYTVERARSAFLAYYTNNKGLFFNMSSWFRGQTVHMYIDSVSWGVYEPDTVAPEITANGVWKSEINKEYTLPTFTAIDERDGVVDIESVKLFKEGDSTELKVTNGKYTFTEEGKYVVTVTAVDAAGNRAEKSFTITVLQTIDEKIIATYDNQGELGVLGLTKSTDGISFVESFTDEDGVTKDGLMKLTFNGNPGAEVVTMVLSEEVLEKMRAANFDYIELVICVDNVDAYNGAYGGYTLYSFNKSVPAYGVGTSLLCKKWQTVRISLEDLAPAGSYLSDTANYTVEVAREKFLTFYSGEAKNFFNMSNWFEGQTVEMYIDSISWGVNEA